jgi:acyl phosphate:glycerol-3-phosphate acyltransferase
LGCYATALTLEIMLKLILPALGGYLIGSVSFAVIVSRAMGLPDPRTYGSGNPGANNVLRSGSKLAAILTLLGDAFKGWLAVWLAQRFSPPGEAQLTTAVVGLCAVFGHIWPVFHRFQGGKGAATAVGVLIAFSGLLGVGVLAVWIVIALVIRISSLATITAALFSPFLAAYIFSVDNPLFISVVLIAVGLICRHHQNIKNLLAGIEDKIGKKIL